MKLTTSRCLFSASHIALRESGLDFQLEKSIYVRKLQHQAKIIAPLIH